MNKINQCNQETHIEITPALNSITNGGEKKKDTSCVHVHTTFKQIELESPG